MSLIELSATDHPMDVFRKWHHEAEEKVESVQSDPSQLFPDSLLPNVMMLATATKTGHPSVRAVLFKGGSDLGIRFFTNYDSRKGQEIAENPYAAAVFFWAHLNRQVRFQGKIR